ncbi:hypothetical protein P3W45_001143 [Vairimorpha bombi]|jgi:hypothetical protein
MIGCLKFVKHPTIAFLLKWINKILKERGMKKYSNERINGSDPSARTGVAQYIKEINKFSYDIRSIIERYFKDGSYPHGHGSILKGFTSIVRRKSIIIQKYKKVIVLLGCKEYHLLSKTS